jgi:antitoxin HigA-1
MPGKLPPVHPGEVLLEEFLIPLGLSQYRLAKGTGVPPRRINEIVHGKRAVTADTALRLSRFFGTSEPFWLNLQTQYDLEMAKDRLGNRLQEDVLVYGADKQRQPSAVHPASTSATIQSASSPPAA